MYPNPIGFSKRQGCNLRVRCYNREKTKNGEITLQIIDFHTHIYPEPIAAKAAQSIRDFYQLRDVEQPGTVAQLLSRGRAAGISRYVVLPVAMKPAQTASINDFILSQVALHPEFIGFGTVHAATENMTDEVQRIMDLGLKGLKMHPDFQLFVIGDPRLFPMYEMIQGKLPVIYHMGDPRYDFSHPKRLRHVLDLFPKLQVVAAHFGGYSMYETGCEYLKDTDCFFDISSSMMFMPEGVPETYIRKYGAERMVFGSDFPLWDPVQEVKRFMDLKLTEDEREQIAHKTAENLLNI